MARVRLRSLKLTGFKSFPDEVKLGFPGRVSAIIGPNGCGKSNIVDAILWVLGEQSPTLMRLKSMGDVVFNGAAGRPAAGAAEVILELESDDGHWPEAGGRLEIRRRVFRSGPSEYRLNGKVARLKDVVDELMTVGLGTRDYSIIEQGRVGQVLSARPTDRRILIEEAAGITRYKKRKHEAELKLEHTRHNLQRLEDVIAEVDRSLRQVKRQASAARRYETLQNELKDALRRLHTLEAHTLDEQRRAIVKRRGEAQNEVAAAAAALGGADADLSQARRELETCHAAVDAAQAEVAELTASRERLEAFLERSADLLDSLRASLERTRNDRGALESGRAALDGRADEAASQAAGRRAELEAVRASVEQAETAHRAAATALAEAETRATDDRQALLRAISGLTDGRNRLGELHREQDRLAYSLGQLEQERDRLAARRTELEQRARQSAEASSAAVAAVEAIEGRRAALVGERSAMAEAATSAKHEAESLGHELWELRHRLQGVERELARHSIDREQLASFLPAEAVKGQVSDYLDPAPGLAPLLDRIWQDWLELPVVSLAALDEGHLADAAELEGRLRLVLAGEVPPAEPTPAPAGADDLLTLAGPRPEALPWLRRTLPRAYRSPDAARAAAIADADPTAIVADPAGVIRRGRVVEPPTAGNRHAGALELREQRRRLTDEVSAMADRAASTGRRHTEVAGRLGELELELDVLDAELIAAEQERARATAVEQAHAADLKRVAGEHQALIAELEKGARRRTELAERQARAEAEVAELESRSLALEQAVESAVTALEARREGASETLRRLDRWQAEARLAAERLAAATVEAERIAEERRSLEARLAALGGEVERLAGELAGTEDEIVRTRTRLAEEQGQLAAAREQARRLGEEVGSRAARVEKLDGEVRQRRAEHEERRDTLHAVEMETTRLDAEWRRLRDATVAELGMAPEKLLETPAGEGEDAEALARLVEDVRGKLERIGPVNLLAIKEVDELEERSTFLATQRGDLVSALKSLAETVREIDATCTERFVETFQQVNAVFTETFSNLFGGGTARLDLVDEDDPLESGIDITAQPPGKRNQSVQLLSGGEKALTALSLLIALFRIKPSPFCILDEVDAPLDDANVERLAELVRAMTDNTQFVLITHNRRTMQHSDLLYGVTMEEPGVSKIVSVRLED
ncbi:MAG: chromosome segregation protein SMC [Thermoanaerobaculales bacterium]|jgi:chromosome segregation protein|nr:chromosome segregation protein SMC [Thermoanaerobaculales bacterium]